jgi:hypothetical protein
VVRQRKAGQTPHDAIREYLLTALAERQPMTGLSDRPHVLRIQRLIDTTPALAARNVRYQDQSERLLADALIEEHSSELTARLVAAQILGAQRVLAAENFRRIIAGEPPDQIYPDAVTATEHAFRLLERGLGDLFRRTTERHNGAAPG